MAKEDKKLKIKDVGFTETELRDLLYSVDKAIVLNAKEVSQTRLDLDIKISVLRLSRLQELQEILVEILDELYPPARPASEPLPEDVV